MIRAAVFALLLATPVAAQDPVTGYADDDAAMNAAITQAQETLPLFLANALDAEQVGRDGTGVKVAIATVSRDGYEHIWVTPFRLWEDGSLSGFLANAPNDLGPLQIGDRVDFTQSQISDWSLFAPDGKMWGNYTSRVMFDAGVFGEKPFEAIFMADPVPEGWR